MQNTWLIAWIGVGDRSTRRFADLPRWAAWSIVGLMGLIAAWGISASFTLERWPMGGMAVPDLDLYRTIVSRVHQGENYYDAVTSELHGMGAGHQSMFQYRQPTYAWLLGMLPDPSLAGWLLLGLATLSVVVAVTTFLPPEIGRLPRFAGIILLMGGTFTWSLYEPDLYLSTEPWCEALLLLSLAAYARERWLIAMALALAALSLRELVLPYCLIAAALSLWNKRWRESALWAVCLAIYAILLIQHGAEVGLRNPGMARTSATPWLGTQGIAFVLLSGSMSLFLRILPTGILAIYLPLALVGLAGWKGEAGTRVAFSAACYVGIFTLIWGGSYWGLLYTPMLILGFCHAPAACYDLFAACLLGKKQTSSTT